MPCPPASSSHAEAAGWRAWRCSCAAFGLAVSPRRAKAPRRFHRLFFGGAPRRLSTWDTPRREGRRRSRELGPRHAHRDVLRVLGAVLPGARRDVRAERREGIQVLPLEVPPRLQEQAQPAQDQVDEGVPEVGRQGDGDGARCTPQSRVAPRCRVSHPPHSLFRTRPSTSRGCATVRSSTTASS